MYNDPFFFLKFLAAGASGSGEFGIALGSNGDILVFSSHCLGVKSDLSLEFDVVVGAWSSINDITGRNYAIGLGTDTAEFLNEYGNDETGGNFKIVYNKDKVPLIYYVSTFRDHP
jgi:hypothetical protein